MTHAEAVTTLRAAGRDPSTEKLAYRLVHACVDALPIDGAAIVWMTETGPGKAFAASDAPVMALEELQFTLGEGPCISSLESGRMVLRPDLATSGAESWPAFTSGALDAGARAVFAFPLHIGTTRIGVLDLYRAQPGVLDNVDLLAALMFTDAATEILLQLQAEAGDGEIPDSLTRMLAERDHVHQAMGMVSVQLSVDLSTALAALRARAFALGQTLDDVADQVITREIRLP